MAVAKITTGNYTLTLTFSEQSTNASQNSSTLSYSLILTKSAGYAWNLAQCPYSVTLNGAVLKSGTISYDFRNYKSLTLTSGETTVTHNADGTGSCTFSGYFNGDNHTAGLETLTTPTETLTLTTIDQGGEEPDPEDITPASPIIELPGEHPSKKILMLDLSDDFEDEKKEFQNVLDAAVSAYAEPLNEAKDDLADKKEILAELKQSESATKEQIAAAEAAVTTAQLAVDAAQIDYDRVSAEARFVEYVPTSTEILTHANTFIAENDLTTPQVNLTLDFYQLSNLKDRIDLGDTVSVYFERLGVSANAKCIRTTWDALHDRYEAIELGSVKATISDTLAGTTQVVQQQQEIIYNAEAEINRTIGKVEQNQLTLDSVKISSESAIRNADLAQAAAEEANAKADAASEEADLANTNASAAATAATNAANAANAASAAAAAADAKADEQKGRLDAAEDELDAHAQSIEGLQSIVGDTGEWESTDTIATIFKDQQTAIQQNANEIRLGASSTTVSRLDAAQLSSDIAVANGNVAAAREAAQQAVDAADDAAVNATAARSYATQARQAATTARAKANAAEQDLEDAEQALQDLIDHGGTQEQIAEAQAAVATARAAYNAADASATSAEDEATRAEATATTAEAVKTRADAQKVNAQAAVQAAQDAYDAAVAAQNSLLSRLTTAETNITTNSNQIALKASQTDLQLLDENKNKIWTGETFVDDQGQTVTSPPNPQVGDLWFKSNTEPIYTYVSQNGSGSWQIVNKYTDDTLASNVATNLQNNYYTKTETDSSLSVASNAILGQVSTTYETIENVNKVKGVADAKGRIFVTTPTPPYDIGDLWVGGPNGDIKRCQTAKATGASYSINDWVLASKYTDDTLAGTKRRVFTTTPTPPYEIGDLWVQGTTGDILKCKTTKAAGASYASTDWDRASKYTDDTVANNVAGDLAANYYNKTAINAAIGVNQDNVLISVDEKIEKIELGTTQILRGTNTATEASVGGWSADAWNFDKADTSTITSLNVANGADVAPNAALKVGWQIKTTTSDTKNSFIMQVGVPLLTGTEYTMSCYAKTRTADAPSTLRLYAYRDSTHNRATSIVVNDTSWKRYSFTFTCDWGDLGSTVIEFGKLANNNRALDICGMKLEAGNKATDWSEYPDYMSSATKSYIDTGIRNIDLAVTSVEQKATIHLGTCETDGGVAAKIATINNGEGFTLYSGAVVYIYFRYANTATEPTLNVNNTGAKPITLEANTAIPKDFFWGNYQTIELIYTGSTWRILNAASARLRINQDSISSNVQKISDFETAASWVEQHADSITTTITKVNGMEGSILDESDVKDIIAQGGYITSATYEESSEAFTREFEVYKGTVTAQGTELSKLTAHITEDAEGVHVSNSESSVEGVFGNDSLEFRENGKVVAWISADTEEGLGVDTIQIGNKNSAAQRWKIFTTGTNGTHLRFTRRG